MQTPIHATSIKLSGSIKKDLLSDVCIIHSKLNDSFSYSDPATACIQETETSQFLTAQPQCATRLFSFMLLHMYRVLLFCILCWCGASITIIPESNVNWSTNFYNNLHLFDVRAIRLLIKYGYEWESDVKLYRLRITHISKIKTYDIKAFAILKAHNSRNAFRNPWRECNLSYVSIVECYPNQNHITWQCNFFQAQH